MADVGNFDTILSNEIKDVYPPGTFEPTFRLRAPFRARLRKDSSFARDAEGLVKYPLKLNGMWSGGIIADNAAFPTPKDPVNIKGQLSPEILAYAIQFGMKTSVAAKSSKSTWNSGGIAADRIEQGAEEMAALINKWYAGTTRSRLTTVESDGSSNFVAAKPHGTTLIEEGMVLEAYTAHSSGSVRDSFSGHKVTAVDHDTRTVTYINFSTGNTDDRTLVAGDSVYIAGTYARSLNGLLDAVDDGTNSASWASQSRTTYPKLKSFILSNGGVKRNLSEALMLEACFKVKRHTPKKVTRILSNDGQWRKYLEFVAPDRRFTGATSGAPKYVTGGDENTAAFVAFDTNCTIEVDDDIIPRSMFFLSWDTFFLYEAAPLDWLEEGGRLKLVPTDGGFKAGFLAYLASVENMGNVMPRANARLDDLNDALCGDS